MDSAKLAYMADQIARNFAAMGEEEAVAATAAHIVSYWDPRMKAQLEEAGDQAKSPIAARAMALVASR